MQVDNSYLIFKNDFMSRSWLDWIVSHITLAPPPFRFTGSVYFDAEGFHFLGYDSYNEKDIKFTIPKNAFTQLYYGFDDTFNRFQTRNFGVGRKPIRFTYVSEEEDTEVQLYVIADFNGLINTNAQLFEELKHWLG
ncbi:MAG: hypothetical protein WA951_00135 [Leeuwenhoekiella sp.]